MGTVTPKYIAIYEGINQFRDEYFPQQTGKHEGKLLRSSFQEEKHIDRSFIF